MQDGTISFDGKSSFPIHFANDLQRDGWPDVIVAQGAQKLGWMIPWQSQPLVHFFVQPRLELGLIQGCVRISGRRHVLADLGIKEIAELFLQSVGRAFCFFVARFYFLVGKMDPGALKVGHRKLLGVFETIRG